MQTASLHSPRQLPVPALLLLSESPEGVKVVPHRAVVMCFLMAWLLVILFHVLITRLGAFSEDTATQTIW